MTINEIIGHPVVTNVLLFAILMRMGTKRIYHYRTGPVGKD
jgi:hypothetical protein